MTRSVLFVLALSSLLFFACSGKDTAKTAPTPPDTTGTADTGTSVEEGTATGTVDTGATREEAKTKKPEDIAPTQEQPTEETPSTPTTENTVTSDTQLAATVRDKLKTIAPPAPSGITVEAQGGVVTLNGTVSSQEEADRIITLVKQVPNVKNVVSNLTIAQQ